MRTKKCSCGRTVKDTDQHQTDEHGKWVNCKCGSTLVFLNQAMMCKIAKSRKKKRIS